MDRLKIRPIQKFDSIRIIKLIKELGESERESSSITQKDLDQFAFSQDDDDGEIASLISGLVAEIENSMIGVVLYHIKYSSWIGPVVHLNTFVVEEKYRRQGVGFRLLKSLVEISLKKNTKYPQISFELRKSNASGSAFFDKHGAVNITRDDDKGLLFYELDLNAIKKLVGERNDKNKDNNVRVRSVERKDCVHLYKLMKELAAFGNNQDFAKLNVEDLQRDGFDKASPDFYAFVAYNDDAGEMIGYIILYLTFDPFRGKGVHLEDLYVTPSHRGTGVGALLFREVGKFVQQNACYGFTLEVFTWNIQAMKFYDKLGATNRSDGVQGVESVRLMTDAILKLQ